MYNPRVELLYRSWNLLFSNTFVIDVPILSKFPDTLATISPYTVKNSNLVHFIRQIRTLGPLCSHPSWGWQVALKGSPQREFHWSTARDTIKLDGLPETSCVREIHFCFCSNQVPGFLYISYTSFWNGEFTKLIHNNFFACKKQIKCRIVKIINIQGPGCSKARSTTLN